MNRQQVLQQLIAVMLIMMFLVGCGGPATTPVSEAPAATPTPELPTATATATPTPVPPTPTPTPLPGPKAGHWEGEGEASISFDVTSEGDIRNFSLSTSLNNDRCTLQLKEIAVETDSTFVFTNLVKELNIREDSQKIMKALGIKMPIPIKTDSGEMFEAQRITGKFDTSTTVAGNFMILVCEDKVTVPAKDDAWRATWKSSVSSTSTPTPEPPTATPTPVPSTATPTPEPPTATPKPVPMSEIKTPSGSFLVVESRFGDRVPPDCDLKAEFGCWLTAEKGYQILFVVFKRPDGGEAMDLKESKGVYVIASDGSQAEVAMAGNFLGPTLAFVVPTSARDFKLVWPDNPPIELGK